MTLLARGGPVTIILYASGRCDLCNKSTGAVVGIEVKEPIGRTGYTGYLCTDCIARVAKSAVGSSMCPVCHLPLNRCNAKQG